LLADPWIDTSIQLWINLPGLVALCYSGKRKAFFFLILSHAQSARVRLGQTNPYLVCIARPLYDWKDLATWHPLILILET